jgi:hypothetical protein
MDKTRPSRRSVVRFSLALAVASVFVASSAAAQETAEGFSLGLAGGFSKATSSVSPSTIGYYVLSTLEFPSPVQILRLRTDGLFADWGGGHVTALTANALFSPVAGRRVAPYFLAGAGAYNAGGSVKAGWALGGGLRLPGLRAITLESRVHAFLRANWRDLPATATEGRWQYLFTPIGLGVQF